MTFVSKAIETGLYAGLLIFASSTLALTASGPHATPVNTADKVCEKCHTDIYRKYLQTPMAKASGDAKDNLIPGSYTQKGSGNKFSVSLDQGQAVLTLATQDLDSAKVESGSPTIKRPISYFLGSGHLGVTYLYSLNNYLLESPVAWYAASKKFDMKPGLEAMTQAPPAIPMQSFCLRCHMSDVQPSDSGTVNRFKGLPFLHTGITCEQCHGTSDNHVSTGGKAAITNPAKLSAERRDGVCINCHLEGDVTVERAGKSALAYKPGEQISTYLAFYVYTSADLTTRGVSEVEQFAKSRCKRISGDSMSCTTCHDPHFSPSTEQRTNYYRAKCLACHNGASFSEMHHPENPDCTSCHMQRTGAENIPHVAWTDHRILRVPTQFKNQEKTSATNELTPVFSEAANKRDLAMAYYKAMLEGNRALEPRAWQLLHESSTDIQQDKEALDALAILNLQRGDAESAEGLFRKVLQIESSDLIALTNLGTLQARKGQLTDSATLLHRAFDHNPDIPGVAANLARIECSIGNASEARKVLQTTLTYNSNLESVMRLLSEMGNCPSNESAPRH